MKLTPPRVVACVASTGNNNNARRTYAAEVQTRLPRSIIIAGAAGARLWGWSQTKKQ